MTDSLLTSFGVVFAVIGLTELVDRTNFALIGLAAKYRPLSVWAGAAIAFWTTTVLAVAVGAALLAALGGHVTYLRLGGGVFLLAYAAYLFFVPESERRSPVGRSPFSTAFLLILLLELGDTTMIFTIAFVVSMPSVLVVALAAGLALTLVAAMGCTIGSRVGARVAPARLERLVVVVLAIVGTLTILYALAPGGFPSWP